MACTAGVVWSAATGRRFAPPTLNKAATSRRTPKPLASSFPYTKLKTDLEVFPPSVHHSSFDIHHFCRSASSQQARKETRLRRAGILLRLIADMKVRVLCEAFQQSRRRLFVI